ncbi:type IV pilin [Halorientalis pallida]|uniref:type IV pilin n=1 Tax=Halorientalis pallida TaxID=2479928 RepID=UPI003C6EBD9D
MTDRAVSPVIGTVLLVAIVVLLAATGVVFFQQLVSDPGEPPQIAVERAQATVDGCTVARAAVEGGSGGLAFYRQNGERVVLDDDGDGRTEAGEGVRLPPREDVTVLANRSGEIYVLDEFRGTRVDCLSVAGSAAPGIETAHGVRFDVPYNGGSGTVGNSLNEITVTYESGAGVDASGVSVGDVTAVGFDRDGDAAIDVSARSDLQSVTVSNGGRTVEFGFIGNYDVKRGDEIVVRFAGIENPTAAGTYTTTVNVNGDVTKTGSVTVG